MPDEPAPAPEPEPEPDPAPAPDGEAVPAPAPAPPGVAVAPANPAENLPMPLIIVSAVCGGLFLLLPLFVRKGPNRGITRCCIMLTIFSMWIFWATVYISQMRPIIGPRLHNTSLAWIRYAWMGVGINKGNETTSGSANETEELFLE